MTVTQTTDIFGIQFFHSTVNLSYVKILYSASCMQKNFLFAASMLRQNNFCTHRKHNK